MSAANASVCISMGAEPVPPALAPFLPPGTACLPPGVALDPGSPVGYMLAVLQIFASVQDYLDVVKLEHVLAGIFIWEYFTTLDIEWRCYTGPKRSPSTAWIYTLCKLSALAYTITNLVGYNVTAAIDCDAWITSRYAFATLSIMCASVLAVLRIATLWDRQLLVMIAASATALVASAFWLLLTVLTRDQGIYVPTLGCQYLASRHEFALALAIVATSFVFLLLLAGGVARRGLLAGPGWPRALYTEGVAWLALATLFAVPDAVLVHANRNAAWNQLLRGPEYYILIIGAIRLYASLSRTGSFTTFRETTSSSGSSGGKPAASHEINIRANLSAYPTFAVPALAQSRASEQDKEAFEHSVHEEGTPKVVQYEHGDVLDIDIDGGAPRDDVFVRQEKAGERFEFEA